MTVLRANMTTSNIQQCCGVIDIVVDSDKEVIIELSVVEGCPGRTEGTGGEG